MDSKGREGGEGTTPVDSDFLHFLLSCFPHSSIRLPPPPPIFLINEEGRKAGKQRPTAPPAFRVGQWERERIVVPEEESRNKWSERVNPR